jgi:hypothetical protein
MTDRKMLELAAKAAGIRLEWDGDPRDWQPMYYEGKTYHVWNPLTNDGDAFRLEVKLKLNIEFGERNQHEWPHIVWVAPCFEPLRSDPYADTRRAIVRAAAEIGKGMK